MPGNRLPTLKMTKKRDSPEDLARTITKAYSRQSYITARLMVDKELINDCYGAYAYFRWVDNYIDDDARPTDERRAFIQRQMKLMNLLYQGRTPVDALPEEKILADLVKRDNRSGDYLQSYVRNFFAALEFDVLRRGRPITGEELSRYSQTIGRAVTNAIFYFIHNGYHYPPSKDRYLAAEAAHVVHMLRDYVSDVKSGFINIPKEYLNAHKIEPHDIGTAAFRDWVKQRAALAREHFRNGKRYIDRLAVLRCKIVAYWYCARFESALDTIERDNYSLRSSYNHRLNPSLWIRMGLLALKVTLKHVFSHIVKKKWLGKA